MYIYLCWSVALNMVLRRVMRGGGFLSEVPL